MWTREDVAGRPCVIPPRQSGKTLRLRLYWTIRVTVLLLWLSEPEVPLIRMV
jgi:hypothetical protein